MHLHNPCLILVPDTFLSASDASLLLSRKRAPATSLLVEFIREEFPNVPLEPIGRKYWNELSGRSLGFPCLASHSITLCRNAVHRPTMRRRRRAGRYSHGSARQVSAYMRLFSMIYSFVLDILHYPLPPLCSNTLKPN